MLFNFIYYDETNFIISNNENINIENFILNNDENYNINIEISGDIGSLSNIENEIKKMYLNIKSININNFKFAENLTNFPNTFISSISNIGNISGKSYDCVLNLNLFIPKNKG